MYVNQVGGMHPAFGTWVERRRQRMLAQLSAIEEERFHDLAVLIDQEPEDPPPQPRNEREREEFRRMLEENEELVRRLASIRAKMLAELRDIERKQVRGVAPGRRSALGGTLDGYL